MNEPFEIYTYCSLGFEGALKLTLPSWIENSGASKIVVNTDHEPGCEQEHERVIRRIVFDRDPEDKATSWLRKIEVIRQAITYCQAPWFCWLDADVYCAAPFGEVFGRMGSASIGATRMFNNTNRGKGDLNAGVFFFRRDGLGVKWFVDDWLALAQAERGKGGWFEQRAASILLHQAFHGQKPFSVAPVSENLYNLEDDIMDEWFRRIELYRPKLIHFKNNWWRHPYAVDRVMEIMAR